MAAAAAVEAGGGDDCARQHVRDVYGAVEPTVTSFLDGYNVCVFAYGQTGSGKTHTLFGN